MLKFIPEDKQPARGLLLNLLTLNRPPPLCRPPTRVCLQTGRVQFITMVQMLDLGTEIGSGWSWLK